MLASPVIWWGGIAAGTAAVVAGVWVAIRGGREGRGRRGRSTWARIAGGAGLAAAGAALAGGIAVYGPWWLHAPTWVLIERFPTYRPEVEIDPVTAELVDRLYERELRRPTRVRIAERCIEAMGPEFPASAGVRAIELLRYMGHEKDPFTPAILERLSDQRLRLALLRQMPEISDMGPGVLREMTRIVADTSATREERAAAAWTLGSMGPRAAQAVDALISALDAPEAPSGRGSAAKAAARALGRIGAAAERALPRLDALAADEAAPPGTRYAARIAAAMIRGEYESEAAAHAVTLARGDVEQRRLAALALRWIGEPRELGPAAEALAAAVDDPDGEVAATARETLTGLVLRDDRYLRLLERVAAERSGARLRALVEELRGDVNDLPWKNARAGG